MNSNLIDRYFRGECTPDEEKVVLSWFRKTALTAEQEAEMQHLWEEAEQLKQEKRYSHDAARGWRVISGVIEAEATVAEEIEIERPAEESKVYSIGHWIREHHYKVAAAILLPLCLLGVMLYYFTGSNITGSTQAGSPLATVEAPLGIKKTIALADGSIITLNSGSKVTYPIPFPEDMREITLEGEAFFEVAKDSLRPFIVHSGTIATQALGTSFNIRYRPEDTTIAVALATGSVKVDRHDREQQEQLVTLTPGQQLVYNKTGQQHQVAAFDTREVLSWKEGTLYFRKATMEQVFRQLEYWYGIEIEVAGNVPAGNNAWNYTGEYKLESLDSVLQGLGFIKHFTFQKKENKIIISFENR